MVEIFSRFRGEKFLENSNTATEFSFEIFSQAGKQLKNSKKNFFSKFSKKHKGGNVFKHFFFPPYVF